MEKVRILFVIRTLLRAGAERMLVNLSNELIKRNNYEVAIYTVNPGNEFKEILEPEITVKGGDVTFRFSLYRKNEIVNKNYIKFVNEYKPDIIHSHLHFGDLLAHSYLCPSAIYFSHQHNSEVQEYSGILWNFFFHKRMWSDYYEFIWLKKKFRKHNTKFIACSSGTQTMLKNKIKFGKITTLPNAVPLPNLGYQYKTFEKEYLNLLWVGRLTDVKRPQLAIQIAAELKSRKVKFKLLIVGEGPNFNLCSDLIKELQLTEQVTLVGLVQKMDNVYLNSDLMIHTAIYEGLPMVFIEANSYGIPIISSDCMPNNEILHDGENGYVIKSENPMDFADKIEKIMLNPTLYKQLSKNSIEISKQFGIKSYVDKLIKIYKKELHATQMI